MATRPEALHWCFTLNNPTIDEQQIIDELEEFGIEYAVFQLEEGENNTPHFQGYVALTVKKRLTAVRTLFGGVAHWEICRGTPTQNRDYCTKADTRIGDFVEIGTLPAPKGARQDLVQLHSALKDGLTQAQYVDQFFSIFVRHPNLVSNYVAATISERDPANPVSTWLLIGTPGTGKSRLARAIGKNLGDGAIFEHSLGKWFDGYVGQRTVLFDDFCGSSLPFSQFKRICDRYPVRVELKGLSCPMAATNFLITTNQDPKTWWKDEVTGQHGHAAITRRIGRVLFFFAENTFRSYPSYNHYATDCLRPRIDGETYHYFSPAQTIVYDAQGEAILPPEILRAEVQ
ncbi:REP [Meles meles circovirus-like virus]|uniref:REP n=1 Tax=Meles meles circovirus-like virus TaxID=1128073 RepID=UPI000243FDEB|nr:REP [Meles meles circovirus-like virus]AEW49399.1 REP [Meles meles circovirus-like virus]